MGKQKWIRLICCVLAVVMALGLIVLTVVSAFAAATRTGRITAENVTLRKGPNTETARLSTLQKGQKVTILGSSGRWYQVKADGKTGYVRDDLIVVEKSASGSEKQAASEKKERPSAAGKELQSALKELGFYSGALDGETGRQTAAAVKAFQKAYGLQADGKAGQETLVALKAAAESGGNGSSAACIAVNGGTILAEWYNAAKGIVPKYEALSCVDVATGEQFVLRCFSKGSHADVEPLTRTDTQTLYRINGSRWCWTPRAIWVYVEGRCYAAAINMQPHGPDTLPDNGMKGQICMHFFCSRQHNTGAENASLQRAVLEAFEKGDAAPAWEEISGAEKSPAEESKNEMKTDETKAEETEPSGENIPETEAPGMDTPETESET